MTKQAFYFEMTDTFGNELNYCWVKRYKITATTEQGALGILARYVGLNFRNNGSYYKARKACIACYCLDYDSVQHNLEMQVNFVELN